MHVGKFASLEKITIFLLSFRSEYQKENPSNCNCVRFRYAGSPFFFRENAHMGSFFIIVKVTKRILDEVQKNLWPNPPFCRKKLPKKIQFSAQLVPEISWKFLQNLSQKLIQGMPSVVLYKSRYKRWSIYEAVCKATHAHTSEEVNSALMSLHFKEV